MKKYILLIVILLIIVGCEKKSENEEETIISSKGDLVCVYKVRYSNEDTLYTSYYEYNFNNNGILNHAKNVESIEFETSDEEIRDTYKESIENIIKEYDDIKGIEVKTSYEKNKYSFIVNMNKEEMSDESIEDYLLDNDRLTLYNQYTDAGYTCE